MEDSELETRIHRWEGIMLDWRTQAIKDLVEIMEEGLGILQKAEDFTTARQMWTMMEYLLDKKRMPLEWHREVMRKLNMSKKDRPKLEVIRKNAVEALDGKTGWD